MSDKDLLIVLEYYNSNKGGFTNSEAQDFLKGKIEFSYGLVGHYANNSNGLFESAGIEKYKITDAGVVKLNRLHEMKTIQNKEIEFKQQLVEVNQSVLDTNTSVRKTNNNQWIWFVATLIVAAIGVYYQREANKSNNSLQYQIQEERKSLKEIRTQQSYLKTQIDSLINWRQDSLKPTKGDLKSPSNK